MWKTSRYFRKGGQLLLLLLLLTGCCKSVNDASLSNAGALSVNPSEVIPRDRAIDIAQRAIAGKAQRQAGAPIVVELAGLDYIVTFVHLNPHGTLGADYDARVRIDAETGEVREILVGP
jgi:hypothetical protein